MKSQNTKSSDQLKREVDKEIRNVKRDLDELEGRLTPGQIIDDAVFYPHGKNLRSTLDHLKRNPIGTAFLSLGTLLLMEDESNQTFESSARTRISTARNALDEKVTSAKSAIREKLPEREALKEKLHHVKDNVQSKVHRTEVNSQFGADAGTYDETLTGAGAEESSRMDKLKGKASELKGKASELRGKASEFKGKASERASHLKERASNLDPMAYMALGAGLGALTGAGLPVSEKEQSFVNDKLSEKFSNLGQELQDAINESSNILKDLVIGDVKNMDFKVFRS